MMHTARWSFTLLFCAVQTIVAALVASVAWLLVGFIFGDGLRFDGLAGVLPVLVVVYFVIAIIKLRQPKLQIQTDRLVVWRGGVQITMLLADFDSVGKQLGIPLSPETLVFRAGTMGPQPGRAGSSRFVENTLRKQKADRVIMPAQFFADWRSSELGSVLPGVSPR
jgi:hypothetical protein